MTLPVLRYLVAFNNGPLDDPAAITTIATPAGTLGAKNVWTDITPWVMGYQKARGRQHELAQFEAGTVTLDLNNQDGRFNPWNTSGPYTGLLTIRKTLRVQATVGGVTYNRFTGHVDAWPTLWADPVTHFAQVHATDAFRYLGMTRFGALTHQLLALIDTPSAMWPLNDAYPVGRVPSSGATGTFADVSGNNNPLTESPYISPAAYQVAGPDSNDLALFNGPTSNPLDGPFSLTCPITPTSATAFSFEIWVKTTINTAWVFSMGSLSGAPVLVEITAAGHVFFQCAGPNTTGTAVVNDGQWHHITVTFAVGGAMSVYVDGRLDASTTNAGATWAAPTQLFPFLAGVGVNNYVGSAALAALYPYALAADQVSAHYYLSAFPQESTDARITRVLDCIGWPRGARNLDSGVSTVQANTGDISTTASLSHIQDVETTEGGGLYIDAAGRLRFINRHDLLSGTVYATSQATFGDRPGDIPFVPVPSLALDDLDVYNEATGQRSGGTIQVAANQALIDASGRSTWQPPGTLLGISDSEVLGLCQAVVHSHATPASRLQAIDVNLLNLSAAQQQTVLGLDLLYRVTVERVGVPGSAFSQVGLVEHIAETATPTSWTVTLGLDVTGATAYWVLGVSQIGVNTALSY